MKVAVAILAAGSGSRFGEDKALRLLAGRPLWQWSFSTFVSFPGIEQVIVVGSESNLAEISAKVPAPHMAIQGGTDRHDSARKALEAASDADVLLIHDAARPFVSAELIERVLAGIQAQGAAAPFVGVTDTIRSLATERPELLNRDLLMAMQTPQGARTDLLRQAYGLEGAFTDDAAALEAAGHAVAYVMGSPDNFKVTYPSDWERARSLAGEARTAIGFGYDIHPFSEDPERPLIVGGVRFDGAGLVGHSDADALTHALVDAILGAAGQGDIGQHYKNTDPRWHNADSQMFLREASALVRSLGWEIENADLTIVAERPKVMPKALQVRETLAINMGIGVGQVNLKATTNEGLGSLGRGEGLAAYAVAQLRRV